MKAKWFRRTAVLMAVTAVVAILPVLAQDDEALWQRLDITEDGWLDGKELDGGWVKFDANGDKEVTKAEFLAGRAAERGGSTQTPTPEEAERLFKKFDGSGNGYLSGTELDAGNARGYDLNGDNIVTSEEFIAGYTKQKPADATKTKTPTKPAASNGTKPTTQAAPATANTQVVQPAPAKIVGGKPVGLYYMQKYWIATRYLEKACWYFAPDGKVYVNLTSGFAPQNLASHKGSKGSYSVAGGKMRVAWSDGQVSESELEVVEGGFNWETGMYMPVEPFAAGKTITGTYEGGTSFGGGGSSSIIVSKTLQLNADGTYALFGIASLKADEVGVGGQGEVKGTWKLAGYIMTLTDSAGVSTSHIAFPFDDKETPTYPDRIFVGGTMYKRQ